MITEIDKDTLRIIHCHSCKTVVAEDNGDPRKISQIVSSVNSHINRPPTFLGEIKHQILTIDKSDGSYKESLVLTNEPKPQ